MSLHPPGSRAFARRGGTYLLRAVAAGMLLASAVACVDGGRDSGGASESGSTPTSSGPEPPGGPTTASRSPQRADRATRQTPTPTGGDLAVFRDGVALLEWLPFGELSVRAVDYQPDGVPGALHSRIDVVTVEECAVSGSVVVRHTTWRLVDAVGRTLGAAGGKVVARHPTEDIPRTLSPGQCMRTELAIGVPPDSVPAAVQDGPRNTWILTD